MRKRRQPDNGCLVYGVEELARVLSIGRSKAYEMVRTGQIRSVRIGRRIVVPRSAVAQLLGDSNQVDLN